MIREILVNLLKESVIKLQNEKIFPEFKISGIQLEPPPQKNHGDYSTNFAIAIAKIIKKSPLEIAQKISEKLKKESKFFEKIEVARPGFINFFISKECLKDGLKEILKHRFKFGNLKIGKGKKVQVEFISANPTGPLTVGNARGGPFGDVLANILEKAAFKTERAYYINDYGKQILSLGHSVLKDNNAQYKGDYIDYLNKKINRLYPKNKTKDPFKIGQKAAKIIIKEMIKKTTDRMGIQYNEWFFESDLHKKGKVDRVIDFLKKKNLTYKKDGALWFKSTVFGDKRDRVLVKKNKEKTYLVGDIAYHQYKFEEKKFDKVINIWGADHYGDAPGLQAGIAALGHRGKLDIVILQFVTLLEKGKKLKMSKRKGVYITMDELLKETGLDIVRFFFLQKSPDTHLNFDLSLVKERSKNNPLYYIQYALVRINSVIRKSGIKSLESKTKNLKLDLLKEPFEMDLLKKIIRLPEVIEDTAKDYQVQRLPHYALNIADAFHRFYENCRVISADNKELTKVRLALLLATKIVLKNLLDLMGISEPKRM